MAKVELAQQKVVELKESCTSMKNEPGMLMNALHKAKKIFGYLTAEVQEVVANEMNVSLAKVYGVVSFYSFFTMTPKGEHPVSICMGTACYVRGAEKVLEEFKRILDLKVGETSTDGKYSINCLRCVGACGLAPVVSIGEKVYGRVAPDEVAGIIKEYN